MQPSTFNKGNWLIGGRLSKGGLVTDEDSNQN